MIKRKTDHGPWCWLEKASLEKIRRQLDNPTPALAVYLALCEIASDRRSDDFQISADHIGSKCGMCRQTVSKQLARLEFIGLVDIMRAETSANMKVSSAYVLLACESQDREWSTGQKEKQTRNNDVNEINNGVEQINSVVNPVLEMS